MKFGVIGAGIVGLTTALELQQQFPLSDVTIIADKFGTDTTSYVAAGIFRPAPSFNCSTDSITKEVITDAFDYWFNLYKSAEGSLAGVTRLGAYHFSEQCPNIVKNDHLKKLLPVYRSVTEKELEICPGNWKYGSYYETVLTDFSIFHTWATNKFTHRNGQLKTEQINSLNNLTGRFDVVVNCSGLGAKLLCNDKKLIPIRGQVIKVRAPWVKTAFYAENDTYIIPGFRSEVTLGGLRQYDDWNCRISDHDSIGIRERCEKLLPSLKAAPIVRKLVGLRPHRDQVRIEPEIINGLRIVHNYGHGGYGITTSPGTAKQSVKLVRNLLSASGSKL